MQLVLLDRLGDERAEGVETDVQRHALDVEPGEQLGREVEPGRQGGGGAGLVGVDGLVTAGIGERLGDVGRQRRLAARLALEPHAPATFAEVLDELDGAVADARTQPPRRPGEGEPLAATLVLEQEHLASWTFDPDPRRHDPGVVDDGQLARELLRQVGEHAMSDLAGAAVVHEQSRGVAPLRRVLGDQLDAAARSRARRCPSDPERSLVADGRAGIERAKARIADAAAGRSAAQLEARWSARAPRSRRSRPRPPSSRDLPERIGAAVHGPPCRGAARRPQPGRDPRPAQPGDPPRLERLEGDLLAERHARIDDLALLVDLVVGVEGRQRPARPGRAGGRDQAGAPLVAHREAA